VAHIVATARAVNMIGRPAAGTGPTAIIKRIARDGLLRWGTDPNVRKEKDC